MTSLRTGSDDKTVRFWDCAEPSYANCKTFRLNFAVSSITFDDHYLAVGTFTSFIFLFDLAKEGQEPHQLVGHVQAVHCLELQISRHLLFSGCNNREVMLWSIPAGKLLCSITLDFIPFSVKFQHIWTRDNVTSAQGYGLVISGVRDAQVCFFSSATNEAFRVSKWPTQPKKGFLSVFAADNSQFAVSDSVMITLARLEQQGCMDTSSNNALGSNGSISNVGIAILKRWTMAQKPSETVLLSSGSMYSLLASSAGRLMMLQHTDNERKNDDPRSRLVGISLHPFQK